MAGTQVRLFARRAPTFTGEKSRARAASVAVGQDSGAMACLIRLASDQVN
jgi:hypothetical protein